MQFILSRDLQEYCIELQACDEKVLAERAHIAHRLASALAQAIKG